MLSGTMWRNESFEDRQQEGGRAKQRGGVERERNSEGVREGEERGIENRGGNRDGERGGDRKKEIDGEREE